MLSRKGSAVARRVTFVSVVVVALSVAVPVGQPVPQGPNRFPLAGLWELITTRPAWALGQPETPAQPRGGPVDPKGPRDPEATRANGGNGRRPAKTPGTLDEWRLPGQGDVPEHVSDRAVVGFQEGTSRPIQDGTSENADAFENADGSRSRKVYPKKVNYRGSDGAWRPIDTRLRPALGGGLEVTASDAKLVFSAARTPAWGGSVQAAEPGGASGSDNATRLVSMTLPTGENVEYGLSGASRVEPTSSGSTATYEEILPDTDVKLTALTGGVKETIVLKSPQAATEWFFPLRLNGLTARLEEDGSVSLVDGRGTVKLIIPHGTMNDSSRDAAMNSAISDAVTYQLITVDGAPALKVTADPAWVRDPARVFPIIVDPSLEQDGNASTFVQRDTNGPCCTNNNSGATVLSTGYHSSGPWNARAFVKFDHFSSTYLGHKVSWAGFYAFVIWAGACASSALRVHDVAAWNPSTVTNWSNQPALWDEAGSVVGTPGQVACVTNDELNTNLGDWWGITLDDSGLAMMNRWTGGGENNGVAIVSDLNANNANWKKIASVWTNNSPFILIHYTPNEKPQVERVYPPHGYASPTLTPELIVRASDLDAWPKPLTYRYQVFDSAGTVVADSGATPIASTAWMVPAGRLEWGKTYVWGVVANDGAHANAPYPLQTFSTQVPQPLITSGLSQNPGGQGFEPNVGNYTTSVTDANVATVGPPLAIQRSYNSRDPRRDTAFGNGWTALPDSKLTISGATAIITYPTGQDVAFGQKPDGTYQAPSGGLSSTLKAATGGGYELRDKSAMVYAFTADAGGGVWKLTSMTDAFGRRLALGNFVSGRPGKITSASGRSLSLTWAQPAGTASWHVRTVSTEPSTPGNSSTINTWTYSYDRDRLVSVCPPTDATHCTTYTYGTNSLLPTAVLDADPHTYLRLNDSATSPAAASSAVDSIDSAVGVYASVASGAGGLPGSSVAAAVFNGTSSYVDLGKALPLDATYQTVSLWFKTTSAGVLYGYQGSPLSSAQVAGWVPALYVDTTGKLRGKFWNSVVGEMSSTISVTDGLWHHAALVGAGSNQWLYLDGVPVGNVASQILTFGASYAYVGAGKWTNWTATTGDVGYFNGSIRDFALYTKPLMAGQIATMYQTGVAASSTLERINRPSGGVQAVVQYDGASGVVRQVTDTNGGVWQVNDSSRSNAGQVYRSTVLSRAPKDYFRLADGGPQYPLNEVNGGVAQYNQVTLGVDGGPLGDEVDVASFNGTSSYVRLPAQDLPKTKAVSLSMWFKMPAGSTAGGVLWSYASHPVEQADSSWGWLPGVYVGTDGKLRAQLFWTGSIQPMTVQAWVNDGLWHHVALTGSPQNNRQSLFLDGVQVGSLSSTILTDTTPSYTAGYVGAGKWSLWPGAGGGTVGFWPGQVGEFAFFEGELTAGEVVAQYASRTRGTSWLGMYPGTGTGAVGTVARVGQQCSDSTAVTGAGDFSGDGKQDVVCRGLDSVLYLHRGNGAGGFIGGAVPFGWGFDGATKLMWPGDFSGDGRPDLVYRRSDNGNLVMLRGDGQGSWLDWNNVEVGQNWTTNVFTVGDFTGDGIPDFFYVSQTDGSLNLWRGNGAGSWNGQYQVDAGDWRSRELLGGKGDFNGDGKPDIVFRSPADKHLYMVRGNGTGGLISSTPVKIVDNQGDRDAMFVAGDFTGDAKADVVFRSTVDPDRPVPLQGVPVKITDVVDPNGNHVRNVHDLSAGGRQIEAINALGKRTTYGYDTGGFVRTVTDPMGNQIVKEYDEKGNVKAETTCQDMSESKCSTTYYSYYFNAGDPNDPRNNKLTEVRDARSGSPADNRYLTTYSYDVKGNLVEVTDALGRKKKNEFTLGNVLESDLKGLSGSGRYVRVYGTERINPGWGYSIWELEVYGGGSCANLAAGRPVTASSTLPGWDAAFTTDGLQGTRWASATASDPGWIYVDLGAAKPIDHVRVLWEAAYGKDFAIQVSNDLTTWTNIATVNDQTPTAAPAGLPSRSTTPGGAAQQVSYASNGDIVRTVDAAGQSTCYARDGLGRISEQSVANDSYPVRVSKLAYDRQDRVMTVTDPATLNHVTGAIHTKTTTNAYDFDGNVTSVTFADATGGDASRTVLMDYNAFGQKKSQSDAKNNKVLLEYDKFGRVVKQTAPDGTVTEVAYDAAGNQTTTKLNGQPIETRAYDAANRLESLTDVMGWQTLRKYTDNNLVSTTTRRDPGTGKESVLESNVYDNAGHLISQVANNGMTVTNASVDAAGRVVSQTTDPSGVNRVISYQYNADDAVTSQTMSGPLGSQTTDALYDTAGRLVEQRLRMPSGAGGPNGWWQLGETSGTMAWDSTPAARHGTLSGGASWSDGGVAFDGTGSVSTTGPALDTTNSFTVSVWAKRTNTPSGDFCRDAVAQDASVMSGFTLGTCGTKWNFDRSASDGTNAGAQFIQSVGDYTPDVWTHVVGVYDKTANSWKLYVNGVLQGSTTVSAPYAATGPTRIGRGKYNGAASGWFTGSVDNVQLYQRVLAPEDVSTLYGGGRTGAAISTSTIRTRLTLNQAGNVLTQTDPNDKVTRFTYDEAGRAVQTQSDTVSVEENGVVTTAPVIMKVGYDTFGGVVEQRDGRGLVTRIERDANGQPVKQISPSYTAPGSSTPMTMTVQTAYNNMGRVDNATDPLGRQTFYTYDQFGNVKTVKTPDLGVTTYTYHPDNVPASVTDPSGARSEATHDYLGRTLTQTQLVRRSGLPTEALVTSYVYYAQSGWLQKVVSPEASRGQTVYEYNNVGEMVKSTDPATNATQFFYDFAGRNDLTVLPDGSKKKIVFDAAGRAVGQEERSPANALLRSRWVAYDNNGNVLSALDARGNTTTFTYDALNRPTQSTQPISATDSIVTSFGYNANGQRTRFTDGRGGVFRTTFNTWNLPESQVDADTATFTTVYDAGGRVDKQLSPGGVSQTFTYDVMDNVDRVVGAGAEVATADRVFDYDAVGRVTSLSGPGGTNTLSYDDRGLLTSVTGPSGNSSYSYTSDGLLASRTDAAGTTGYTYDASGRLKTVDNTTAGLQMLYDYNNLSQVGQITYGANQNRRVFGYDNLHRLQTDELKTAAGASIGKITYGWDANDNETSKTTVGFAGSSANTYTYDWANRLTSWNGTVYAYDKSGNRTQTGAKTFTYSPANRLQTSSDGTTYEYTVRGTLRRTTVGTVTLETRSDAFDQVLRQYSTATQYSEYSYDGLGRVLQAGFSYTGVGNDLAKDTGTTYVRSPGGGVLGSRTGGSSSYAWTDLHTDVVGQFTATGTTLGGSTTYEPFGKVNATNGMQGSLGYQSEWTDSQTKRVNMHARWYNPETGQFDSRDTVNVSNRFNYVNNNPLTSTDPTGHMANWRERDCHIGMCRNTTFNDHQTARANFRFAEKRRKAEAAERARVSKLTQLLPECMKREKKVRGRPVEEVSGCAGAQQKCGQAKGSRFDRYGDAETVKALKNCTVLEVRPDGSCSINGVEMGKDDAPCHDPYLVAKNIDNYAGRMGGYMPDGQMGDKKHLTAILINQAVVGAEAEKLNEERATCQADWWCRNSTAIGNAVDVIVSVVAFAACTAATAGAGVIICAAGAAFIGGFTGELVTGKAKGLAWDDPELWKRSLERGITSAVLTVATAPLGGALGALARPLSSLGSRAMTTSLGRSFANVGTGIAESRAGQLGIRAFNSRAGRCLTEPGLEITTGLAEVATGRSFDPATKVLMADGRTVAIGALKVGDRVAATDPDDGQTTSRAITAVHVNFDTDLVDVAVTKEPPSMEAAVGEGRGDRSTRGPTATVHTTANHPFWDAKTRRWTKAAELKPHGSILAGPDGQVLYVTAVTSVPGFKSMRDLTVANVHTYYVMAADTPVLVHNDSCTRLPSTSGPDTVIVLGRRNDIDGGDINVARPWPKHEVLTLPRGTWTVEQNLEWVRGAIAKRQSVYLASPLDNANLYIPGKLEYDEVTVLAREIAELMDAGYTFDGDYMRPPPLK